MNLNRIQILGRTTSDVELKSTPNGTEVANVNVATNKSYTDNSGIKHDQANFHNVVIWGKLAGVAAKYLTKGSRVLFEGESITRSWEAQDGSKRYKTEIVASNMIMLSTKPKDEFEESDKKYHKPTEQQNGYKKKKEEEISIDDIPF